MPLPPLRPNACEVRPCTERGREMTSGDLDSQRQEIDRIDEALMGLLSERLRICLEIARNKRAEDLPAMQPARAEDARDRAAQKAATFGLESNFVRALWD